jgi:hypothetical protein
MATYNDVIREVVISAGLTPKTCWTAHVLELLGVKLRKAPNRINAKQRQNPCPPAKMPAIAAALYRLGKVRPA